MENNGIDKAGGRAITFMRVDGGAAPSMIAPFVRKMGGRDKSLFLIKLAQ